MTTKLYTKDEIVEKAKEIAHMIANTEEVEFFKKRKNKLMKINLSAKRSPH